MGFRRFGGDDGLREHRIGRSDDRGKQQRVSAETGMVSQTAARLSPHINGKPIRE